MDEQTRVAIDQYFTVSGVIVESSWQIGNAEQADGRYTCWTCVVTKAGKPMKVAISIYFDKACVSSNSHFLHITSRREKPGRDRARLRLRYSARICNAVDLFFNGKVQQRFDEVSRRYWIGICGRSWHKYQPVRY